MPRDAHGWIAEKMEALFAKAGKPALRPLGLKGSLRRRKRQLHRRAGHFSGRKWPTTIASMPEDQKLRTASRGVHTGGSPKGLKLVPGSAGRAIRAATARDAP